MVKYITSAFSLGMLEEFPVNVKINEISKEEFEEYAVGSQSRILHNDIAERTGYQFNKRSINARAGDTLLIVQEDFDKTLKYHCMKLKEENSELLNFIKKYQPLFGVNLTEELLTDMALSCFMEDVEKGQMDIIGLSDRFDFNKEQLELTPTEEAVNRKLQVINELEGMRNV